MDEIDRRLISALRHDARASLSELAQSLNVSRTTIRSRIERLRRSGEIIGFTVILRGDAVEDPVRGLMMIGIEGRGADRIRRQLQGLSAVRTIHSTNGRWDLIVEIGTTSLQALDDVLDQIRKFEGISTSETSLLLSTKKASRSAMS